MSLICMFILPEYLEQKLNYDKNVYIILIVNFLYTVCHGTRTQ